MARLTLALFDIDGTLLRSAGGGRGAMAQAASSLFGRPDLFDDLSFAGAVDNEIVARALANAGIPPTPRRIGRMRASYGRALKRTLPARRGSVCPGVVDAVRTVAERAEVGLLTGNWEEGARTKLQVYRLWHMFDGCVGAFGSDGVHRDELIPVAHRRAVRRWGQVDRVVLIGDTPADVQAARAASAVFGTSGPTVIAVAVGTGYATPEALEASKPDLLVPDLAQGLEALLGCL